tara:strand:+ start:1607 stop:1768 length:162 start_codon:yes stop_codon:yes gene_type:complete
LKNKNKNIMAKKINEYFKKMNAARKKGAKSFSYKGDTYVAKKSKTGLMVYKKK